MHPTSVTVGIPVGDLAAAIAWYDAVLDRQPAIEPAAGSWSTNSPVPGSN